MSKRMKIVIGVICGVLIVQTAFIGWRYNYGPLSFLGQYRLKGLAGNSEQYSFSYIEPLDDSPLKGKNVLFLGSSVTNGKVALYNSIPEYISKRFDCTYTKEAVDGTTLTDNGNNSYVQRLLNNINVDDSYDLLICQLSTNDASKDMPLGDISEGKNLEDFDTSTITGAIEYIIAYSYKTWNCPVVFYTNAKYDNENYDAMVNRLYELKDKWDIGILDLWSSNEFNNITDEEKTLYMYDNIHPTMAGYRNWWGPELEKQLLSFLNKE